MRSLKFWAFNKPFVIAIIAPQIASSSNSCFEALNHLKIDERFANYPILPKSKDWMNLYTGHRRIEKTLKEIYRRFNQIADIGVDFFEIFTLSRKNRRILGSNRFNNRIKKELEKVTSEEWKETWNFWNDIYNASMDDLEAEFSNRTDDELTEKFKASLLIPEMVFFLRIWTPSWLIYKELPPFLLRKARNGDVVALEKILRLDSAVLKDPKIFEIYHQSCGARNKSTFDIITKSLRHGIKNKITLQKIKMNFAGLIAAIAYYIRFQLTEPDLRALFDAISIDSGKGPIDTDIPESPEAFAKAIQREKKFWIDAVTAWTKNS